MTAASSHIARAHAYFVFTGRRRRGCVRTIRGARTTRRNSAIAAQPHALKLKFGRRVGTILCIRSAAAEQRPVVSAAVDNSRKLTVVSHAPTARHRDGGDDRTRCRAAGRRTCWPKSNGDDDDDDDETVPPRRRHR